nr:hypothetical protein [Thiocapsa rosea]
MFRRIPVDRYQKVIGMGRDEFIDRGSGDLFFACAVSVDQGGIANQVDDAGDAAAVVLNGVTRIIAEDGISTASDKDAMLDVVFCLFSVKSA